jgi:hypothetical protein
MLLMFSSATLAPWALAKTLAKAGTIGVKSVSGERNSNFT